MANKTKTRKPAGYRAFIANRGNVKGWHVYLDSCHVNYYADFTAIDLIEGAFSKYNFIGWTGNGLIFQSK